MKRRTFLAGLTSALAGMGMAYARVPSWHARAATKDAMETLGTARNLIYILLEGAPSHVDTFDLKTGDWTPNALGAATIDNILWPAGYMPQLAQRLDRVALVRSLQAVEAVHSRAVYHQLTAHRQNNALMSEIPHFASVLSYKLESQRAPHHSLPTVMMIGYNPAGNGFLPIEHLGMTLDRSAGIPNLEHGFAAREGRLELLDKLLRVAPHGHNRKNEHLVFQLQARGMMDDADLRDLLPASDPYAQSAAREEVRFTEQCRTAVDVLAADLGTRVFQLELGNWDHHSDIYGAGSLPYMAGELDRGMALLLDELAARPGVGGGSLLDETLIVAMGEFGRTTGDLNTARGRDHYPYALSAMLAGGGVQGGRVIGETDRTGSNIIDPGWSQRRYMTVEDLSATVYSAMGVDWSEKMGDTPSGRVFELVDTTRNGELFPISDLFA